MKDLKSSLLMFIVCTVLLGGVYPAVVTGLSRLLFPQQAAGSLLYGSDGRVIGSALIGQPFSAPQYFWPRPSATADFPNNPLASGGANLGPGHPVLLKQVAERLKVFQATGIRGPLPSDLVLASASGLDPHITPEAAKVQIPRVARSRGLSEEALGEIVAGCIEARTFGLLGQERINVLALNIALDMMKP